MEHLVSLSNALQIHSGTQLEEFVQDRIEIARLEHTLMDICVSPIQINVLLVLFGMVNTVLPILLSAL